jgi:hypothetical protein
VDTGRYIGAYPGEVVIGVRADFGQATGELRELEYLLYRTFSVLSRLGLPPQIDAAIMKIERIILVIRMLHSALMYFGTGSIYGVALGVITSASALLSMEMQRR